MSLKILKVYHLPRQMIAKIEGEREGNSARAAREGLRLVRISTGRFFENGLEPYDCRLEKDVAPREGIEPPTK